MANIVVCIHRTRLLVVIMPATYQVTGVLEIQAIAGLSSDWGKTMENHPLRAIGGKDKKGNVMWMIDPQEGFVQR